MLLSFFIKRTARVLSVEITDDAAYELATRSRGTPRIANRLFKRVRDFALVFEQDMIDEENSVSEFGENLNDNEEDKDRKYLRREREHREFSGTFYLGRVDDNSVEATFKDGLFGEKNRIA